MNTIHPSAARVHPSPMSTKDAVTSAPQDKISKRSTNHVRQDPRQLVKPRDHHDRQAPPPATTLESRDGATFNASSNHSRQTWTHSAFSKYIPGSDIADKGHSQQQAHSHTHTSGLSLAGVCTVLIDPYTFVDTKFYTLDTKSDPVHQVVMEFKDNPGALWLFPDEASLEFTPVNDHKSTQISASFSLPHLATTTDRSHLATLVIQHGTTALREGLELAVKGSKTTITPSSHKPTDPPTSRSHTPSTYSDDPSEILGSGRQSVSNNNSSNNGNTNHSNTNNSLRKQDPMSENQKSLKSKRPKDQDEKSAAVSSKKKVVAPTTPKKNGLPATPASTAQQKRCGYCNCITTPMWRRGPNGPGTLCNACGVKWKHGKILQDVQETVQAPKSIPVSSSPPSSGPSTTTTTATTTTNARAAGPKSAKQSPQNGTSRHVDEIKSESNNTTTTTTKKRPLSSHGAPRKDVETRSGEKSSSRENKRSRVVEPDKLVPVKKRHSSKASVSPPGPRMVSVHELGDPTRIPFESSASSKKHVHDDDVDDDLILPNGHFDRDRNDLAHADHITADTSSSSASTISTRSDMVTTGTDNDMQVESTPPNVTMDEDLSGDTMTFPVHLPTVSIAFGPNNAYYNHPNCAVTLHESHFQIMLEQTDEKTEIDVWKEGVEATEFEAIDDVDGESVVVMKVLLRQYLTRFDKELLNPDRNECLIVFRFREQLDGNGHSVKPLLDYWLTTDIPIPPSLSSDSI